jgi:hypothetical protein
MLVPSYNGYGVPGTGMPPAPADGTVAAYPSRHRGPAPHISPQPGLRPVHKRTSCMIHTLCALWRIVIVCSVEDSSGSRLGWGWPGWTACCAAHCDCTKAASGVACVPSERGRCCRPELIT